MLESLALEKVDLPLLHPDVFRGQVGLHLVLILERGDFGPLFVEKTVETINQFWMLTA